MEESPKKKTAKKAAKKVEAAVEAAPAKVKPVANSAPVNLTRERLRVERGNETAEAMVKD